MDWPGIAAVGAAVGADSGRFGGPRRGGPAPAYADYVKCWDPPRRYAPQRDLADDVPGPRGQDYQVNAPTDLEGWRVRLQ